MPEALKGIVKGVAGMLLAAAVPAAGGEAWYIPGWLRSAEPESGAWKSFKDAVGAEQVRFWTWDGDRTWSKSAANADAAAQVLADELAALPPERRANLTLVGHSLGGRMLARALALPAVTGLGDITSRVKPGEFVLLDGTNGAITLNPDKATIRDFSDLVERQIELNETVSRGAPAGTLKSGGEVRIFANVHPGVPLAGIREQGARGIGLYRSEYLWLIRGTEPT